VLEEDPSMAQQGQQPPSSPQVQPYLFFGGRCEEALEFYREALGAQVEMMLRFDQSPQPLPPGALQAGFEHSVCDPAS
jgi:PhnB protein